MGGDIGVFRGGSKVLGGKVQSPESRVQSPGSSRAFRICHRRTATWNLIVLYNKERKLPMMTSSMRLSSNRS